MGCFGKYLTHAQICDNVRVHNATQHMPKFKLWQRVQSATEWAASVHTLHTPEASQSCDILCVQSATEWTASVHIFTHAQSCDNVNVHSAMDWAASVNTLHMPKSVITFVFIMLRNTCPNLSCDNVFKVLRNGRLRYILYTCPKHPKAVISFVFKVLRNGLLRYIFYACPKLW